MPRRLCVVGGGWAGIAAAVQGVRQGDHVTLLEMAAQLGGRARRVTVDGLGLDNGQHILIGAYTETLHLMRGVGVDVDDVLERRPLELLYPDGGGLVLPAGAPMPSFVRGVLSARGWTWHERLALLRASAGWAAGRFRCAAHLTVSDLTRSLPARMRLDVIDPLCVAALNTPSQLASASVFLRVLRDALFSGPGSADLLLPRRSLSALLPDRGLEWLSNAGAVVRPGTRAGTLVRAGVGWEIDGERFDAVVLACSANEAARLAATIAPAWAAGASAFDYEPIVTVYLQSEGSRLPRPMTALRCGPDAPAQFVFDHGLLGGTPGLFAAVVSGARPWVERGASVTAEAARRQVMNAFPPGTWKAPATVLRALTERRATFLCTPALERPPLRIAPALHAAGDYVEGPYPATLEGAVRAGLMATSSL
jgi:squalene-associated FAD-dependent desaturase